MKDKQKNVLHMIGELTLTEQIGDNTVDNMINELSRAANIELNRFIGTLLMSNVQQFLHCYHVPQFQPFRDHFKDIMDRYQVMDGAEQGDLFRKLENLWKDILVQFIHIETEIAELIAKKYAVQMIDYLKSHSVRANTDLAHDRRDVYY